MHSSTRRAPNNINNDNNHFCFFVCERHAKDKVTFIWRCRCVTESYGNQKINGNECKAGVLGSIRIRGVKLYKVMHKAHIYQSEIETEESLCKFTQIFLGLFVGRGLRVIQFLSAVNVRAAGPKLDRSSTANVEIWRKSALLQVWS